MKASIFLFAVICIVGVFSHDGAGGHDHHMHHLTDDEKAKIHKEVEDCKTESGVSQQLLDDIKADKDFTPTRELDCFSACILKKNGSMNEDGTLNVKDHDNDKAKECKKLTGKDACETAGKVMECFAKNDLIPKFEHDGHEH